MDGLNELFEILDFDSSILGVLAGYLIFIVILYIGLAIVLPIVLHTRASREGKRSKGCAYLLLIFWPLLALHRFYANKTGSAVLWIFTGGFFGIGFLVDLFLTSSMIDEYNRNIQDRRDVRHNNRMMQQNMQMQQNMMMQMQQKNQNQRPQIVQAPQNIPPVKTQNQVIDVEYRQQNPVLIGLSGEYSGVDLPLDTTDVILGRDPAYSHLVFNNTDFSRKHCAVSYRNGNFILTDLSTNGTFLTSGERLEKGRQYQLNAGDSFYIMDRHEMFKVDYA